MDVKLNDDAMTQIIQKAIIDSLTPERREEMLSAAVKSILSVPVNPGSYGEKRSILQAAFDNAVQQVAYDYVRTELSGQTEFREKVKKLFEDVAAKLFEQDPEEYDSLIQRMARAISHNMTRD